MESIDRSTHANGETVKNSENDSGRKGCGGKNDMNGANQSGDNNNGNPEALIERYAGTCGFTFGEVAGSCRKAGLMIVRQLIWMQLRERGTTYARIAELTNRHSHTVILHGVKRIEDLIRIGDRQVLECFDRMRTSDGMPLQESPLPGNV